MQSFIMPKFLQDESINRIHKRMLDGITDNIDKSEGSILWDFTRPTAIEKDDFIKNRLGETIKTIFPQWAVDEYLDMHAQIAGLVRKSAQFACGELTITGINGTQVPEGSEFAVPSNYGVPVLFVTTKDAVIENNEAVIPIRAKLAGKEGNVEKDTIILAVKPRQGVVSITNKTPLSGGIDAENDELLRSRILDVLRTGISHVGNNGDYRRWAMEVDGVDDVKVIPCEDGMVRLIIMNSNKQGVAQEVLDAVYAHIMSPQDPIKRLAPIGAKLTVETPQLFAVRIKAVVSLQDNALINNVKQRLLENLAVYYKSAAESGVVRYVHIGALLAAVEGVADYTSLTINDGVDNIAIGDEIYPITREDDLDVHT